MIPITTTAPRDHGTPRVVYGILLTCCVVFLYQASLPYPISYEVTAQYGLIPRRYSDPFWARQVGLDPTDYGPLLYSTFLHGGWLHLIFNMWTLWLFGRAVEQRMGLGRFAILYALCALLAGYAHMAVYPGSPVPVIGASGAIAGVLGAHATLFPQARVVILIPIIIIPFFFRVSAFWYVAIWFGLQVFQGAGALGGGTGGGVAWWAHIGGFLAGLAFVRFLTPPR